MAPLTAFIALLSLLLLSAYHPAAAQSFLPHFPWTGGAPSGSSPAPKSHHGSQTPPSGHGSPPSGNGAPFFHLPGWPFPPTGESPQTGGSPPHQSVPAPFVGFPGWRFPPTPMTGGGSPPSHHGGHSHTPPASTSGNGAPFFHFPGWPFPPPQITAEEVTTDSGKGDRGSSNNNKGNESGEARENGTPQKPAADTPKASPVADTPKASPDHGMTKAGHATPPKHHRHHHHHHHRKIHGDAGRSSDSPKHVDVEH